MCELCHSLLLFLGLELLLYVKLDLIRQVALSCDLLLDLETRIEEGEDSRPVVDKTLDQIACPLAYFHFFITNY